MASDDLSVTMSSTDDDSSIIIPEGVHIKKLWKLGKRGGLTLLVALLDANGFEGYIGTTFVIDASSEARLARFRRLIDDSWSPGRKSRNLLGEMISEEATDDNGSGVWMVKRILAVGANPDVQHGGFKGRSILSVAIKLGRWKIAEALLLCLSGAEIERQNPAVEVLLESLNEKAEILGSASPAAMTRLRQMLERTANRDHPTIAELAHDKKLFFAARNRCRRRVVDYGEAVMKYEGKGAIRWMKLHGRMPVAQEMRYLLLGEVIVPSSTALLGEVTSVSPSTALLGEISALPATSLPDASPDGRPAPLSVHGQQEDLPDFSRGNKPVYEDRNFLLLLKQSPYALQFPSHLLTNANSQPIWKLTPDSASEVLSIKQKIRLSSGKAVRKFDFMPSYLIVANDATGNMGSRLSGSVMNPQNGMADGTIPEKSSSLLALTQHSSMPKKVDEVMPKPQSRSDELTQMSPVDLVFQHARGVEEKGRDVSMKIIRPDLVPLRANVRTEELGRDHLASEMRSSHEFHQRGTVPSGKRFGTALENIPPRFRRLGGHAESGPSRGPNSLIADDGTTQTGDPIQIATLELLKGVAGVAATDPSLELLEDVIRILRKHKKN